MRPLRPGLSIRPPISMPRPAYYIDGSEEDDEFCSSLYEREPSPYGPVRPGTPLYPSASTSESTVSSRPSTPTVLSPTATPLSNPSQFTFPQNHYMNGFPPPPNPGYWPGQPPRPSNPPISYNYISRPPPPVPTASMWASQGWPPPPTYTAVPELPRYNPRRPGNHIPNHHNNSWMPDPEPDPIPTTHDYRGRSPKPILRFRRSRSNIRPRSASETRVPVRDPRLVAALKAERRANQELSERLRREEKERAKRKEKEMREEIERGRQRDARLKETEEELKRYKLYDQKNRMKQEIKNEIYAEMHQGSPTSPTLAAGLPGGISGLSSEETPSSGPWTSGGLAVRHHAPKSTDGGIPMGSYLYDEQGNPRFEIYAKPITRQDVGVRGRHGAQRLRFG
ncbi:hypothetical protein QBC40DRAFT_270940 [Triangularia verruculosa]|uniref:Uncharacterized protein n=1 Tax=Triangularia verruculosa TaxID=2587418 RepID=A0AAN6XTV4_9PEZI|nr:hypothetical protein QBC40DRAFT_270940 [Triangularia verruculosa]